VDGLRANIVNVRGDGSCAQHAIHVSLGWQPSSDLVSQRAFRDASLDTLSEYYYMDNPTGERVREQVDLQTLHNPRLGLQPVADPVARFEQWRSLMSNPAEWADMLLLRVSWAGCGCTLQVEPLTVILALRHRRLIPKHLAASIVT
jgi:hypothetical protein